MSAHLYIEGGQSRIDQIRCREGFRKLLERAGFSGRMPRMIACGGRGSAFEDFKIANDAAHSREYVAILIDSEDPVADTDKTWEHLKVRDNWDKPARASDEQVLFMTTCMETWIVADRATLRKHYGHKLRESALPPLVDLENRDRHDVHDKLALATRACSNAYAKGKRSFEALAELDPSVLKALPSFARVIRILKQKL